MKTRSRIMLLAAVILFALPITHAQVENIDPNGGGSSGGCSGGIICGAYCITGPGEWSGYCNGSLDKTQGCAFIDGGCMSMRNVPCCQSASLF
jgi:hypothetical protein